MSDIPYDNDLSVEAWKRIPVDDFEYVDACHLLQLRQSQFKDVLKIASSYRYSPNGWRNRNNSLFRFMNFPKFNGKIMMDYGCGLGLDALHYCFNGCSPILADINPVTLKVACNTLGMEGNFRPERVTISLMDYPFLEELHFDLFWSFGVLHHTPNIRGILQRVCSLLNSGGECRIGLHSDKMWESRMEEPLPKEPIHEHPRFMEWVRKLDTVGNYLDWYNQEKIEKVVEGFGRVTECNYICDGNMIGVVIEPIR